MHAWLYAPLDLVWKYKSSVFLISGTLACCVYQPVMRVIQNWLRCSWTWFVHNYFVCLGGKSKQNGRELIESGWVFWGLACGSLVIYRGIFVTAVNSSVDKGATAVVFYWDLVLTKACVLYTVSIIYCSTKAPLWCCIYSQSLRLFLFTIGKTCRRYNKIIPSSEVWFTKS